MYDEFDKWRLELEIIEKKREKEKELENIKIVTKNPDNTCTW